MGATAIVADVATAAGCENLIAESAAVHGGLDLLVNIDSVSDITFSQTMSTPEQIADLILACAADGRIERSRPALSRVMATAGYLLPALPRALRPLLAAKGRRAKARYRR